MRAVVMRVKNASVLIEGREPAEIGMGLLVLLGVHEDDTEAEARQIADKSCGLRIFEDEAGKMNVNPRDAGAELLIISQFTLFADCRSRRPGFSHAARPDKAIPLSCDFQGRVVASCRITDKDRTDAAVPFPSELPPRSFLVAILARP